MKKILHNIIDSIRYLFYCINIDIQKIRKELLTEHKGYIGKEPAILNNLMDRIKSGGIVRVITYKEAFTVFCERPDSTRKTFSELLKEILETKDLLDKSKELLERKKKFSEKTKLNGKKLSNDCSVNPYYKPKMYTLISIAMGYEFNKEQLDDLLLSAGAALEPIDDIYRAYLFLIEKRNDEDFKIVLNDYKGDILHACNFILEEIGIDKEHHLGRRNK